MAHEHNLVIRDDFTRPDNQVRQVERQCICGLSERRFYLGPDTLAVKYRYAGLGNGWVDAADLLQLTYPVALCDACQGVFDEGCERCKGARVQESDGGRLVRPPKPPSGRPVV